VPTYGPRNTPVPTFNAERTAATAATPLSTRISKRISESKNIPTGSRDPIVKSRSAEHDSQGRPMPSGLVLSVVAQNAYDLFSEMKLNISYDFQKPPAFTSRIFYAGSYGWTCTSYKALPRLKHNARIATAGTYVFHDLVGGIFTKDPDFLVRATTDWTTTPFNATQVEESQGRHPEESADGITNNVLARAIGGLKQWWRGNGSHHRRAARSRSKRVRRGSTASESWASDELVKRAIDSDKWMSNQDKYPLMWHLAQGGIYSKRQMQRIRDVYVFGIPPMMSKVRAEPRKWLPRVGDTVRSDKNFMSALVAEDGALLQFASDELRNDWKFCAQALRGKPYDTKAVPYFGDDCLKEKEKIIQKISSNSLDSAGISASVGSSQIEENLGKLFEKAFEDAHQRKKNGLPPNKGYLYKPGPADSNSSEQVRDAATDQEGSNI